MSGVSDIGPGDRICRVTNDAREQLQDWGCTDPAIDQLAQISARYRYDDCVPKMTRIAQRGGYVIGGGEGEAVVLPDFFDFTGDRTGGQCGEIAAKVFRDLRQEKWIDKVNDGTRRRSKLRLSWISGEPRTHFTAAEQHLWLALAPAKAKPQEMITIDGSFLEISKQDSNGYNPRRIGSFPTYAAKYRDETVRLGELDYDDSVGRWSAEVKRTHVLGLTQDLTHVAFFGFLINRTNDEGEICPVIQLRNTDKTREAYYAKTSQDTIWFDNDQIVTPALRTETEELATIAETILVSEK